MESQPDSINKFCGLNLKKHKSILDDLELNELISRNEVLFGKRTITVYRPSPKGVEFCRTILEPYETMFPRRKGERCCYQ